MNNEARRELPDGRRINVMRVDFNIVMFIGTAYLMAYFFLIGFVSLILSNGNVSTHMCSNKVVMWFQVSVAFYILAFVICAITLVMVRKHGLRVEVVNLGDIELVL